MNISYSPTMTTIKDIRINDIGKTIRLYQFYDGMVVMDVDGREERSLTAVWEDRHLVIDIRTNNGQILIKYTQVNAESWPDRF